MTNKRDDHSGRRPPRGGPGGRAGGKPGNTRPYSDAKRPPRTAKGDPARARPAADAPATPAEPTEERIAKAMARAGVASRRDAEVMIEEGRVRLNGVLLTSPAQNVTASDRIEIDGEPMPMRERTRLWLFHKPRGLVTTARDPEGRPTVFDNLPEDLPRVVAIGRLDINTEGLLLLTNDGGLAKVIAHPDTGWLRRYRVRAYGEIDQAQLDKLRDGVVVDGMEYGPIEAKLDRVQGDNAWLMLGLREGKNREVKRVLEHLGLRVNRLIRLSFGPFQLGDLAEGAVEEVRTRVLKDQLGDTLAKEAGVDFESPVREPIAPFGPPPEEARPRRDRSERGSDRGRGDRDGDRRGPARAEQDAPPRRPAWDRKPRASIWRADESEEDRKFKPRRKTDPKADRTSSAERPRERVGAIAAKGGGRVLVERLKSAPQEEAPREERQEKREERREARPARRDDARPARRDDRAPRSEDRAPRSGRSEDRAPRASRNEDRAPRSGAGRPQRDDRAPPRGDGPRPPRDDRRPRPDGERRERPAGAGARPYGKPSAGKPGSGGGRPGGRRDDAGGDARPRGGFGGKPGEKRDFGDRKGAAGKGGSGRDFGERKSFGAPGGGRGGDRPGGGKSSAGKGFGGGKSFGKGGAGERSGGFSRGAKPGGAPRGGAGGAPRGKPGGKPGGSRPGGPRRG